MTFLPPRMYSPFVEGLATRMPCGVNHSVERAAALPPEGVVTASMPVVFCLKLEKVTVYLSNTGASPLSSPSLMVLLPACR